MKIEVSIGPEWYSPETRASSRGILVSAQQEVFLDPSGPEAHALRERGWRVGKVGDRVIAAKEETGLRCGCSPQDLEEGFVRTGRAGCAHTQILPSIGRKLVRSGRRSAPTPAREYK